MRFQFHGFISVIFLTGALVSPVLAEALNEAIDTGVEINQSATRSQKKIDKLSEETRLLLEQYRSHTREYQTLKQYNAHLLDLVLSQQEEKFALQRQLDEIEVTQREIVPLILRMLETLEEFVQLDVPFLPEERRNRIMRLNELMIRADVSSAEKYRRILEAYQIENDYGKTIEAYRADLKNREGNRTVDFLRLGRIALYYQAFDGDETGYWNRESQQWEVLPSEYRKPVRDGLRIARKEMAPDLLTLPVPTSELGL